MSARQRGRKCWLLLRSSDEVADPVLGLSTSLVHLYCSWLYLEVTSVPLFLSEWRQESGREVKPLVYTFISTGHRKYIWVSLGSHLEM